MSSILQWIVNDVESLVPQFGFNKTIQAVPAVGGQAPPSPLMLADGKNVVLFTRHLGCPFCEREIKSLIALARLPENNQLNFTIVSHSVSSHELDEFVIKELEQVDLPRNVNLYGDAERRVYKAFGLGELGWGDVINGEVLHKVSELKTQEGISNRLTRGTRWQTNGGFSIDSDGRIRYAHVGKNSADMMDLGAAIESLRD